MLLTEFDDNRQAIINPQDLHEPIEGFSKVVISCFSRVTFARLLENYDHEVIAKRLWLILKSWSMGLRLRPTDWCL